MPGIRPSIRPTAARVFVAAVVAVLSTTVLTPPLVSAAASWTSRPERLYVQTGSNLSFTGTDGISGDSRVFSASVDIGPLGCDLTVGGDYDIDDCPRVQMSVTHGVLRIGDASQVTRANNTIVNLLPDGAAIDVDAPSGLASIGFNGTQAQLNAALADLVYVPDAGYKYDGSNPENLQVTLVDGDGTPLSGLVTEIRVLGINTGPLWTDTLSDQTVQPEIETTFTDAFEVNDLDNNDAIDGNGGSDPDGNDGASNEMLLVGVLDCGQAVAANTGFHFGSSVFQADDPTIDDLLTDFYDVGSIPAAQGIVDAILTGIDAIEPGLSSRPLATSQPFDYTTAFAGISDIVEVRSALDTIFFLHNAPSDTCTLTLVVSDLGNNGLPTAYVGSPPTGTEIPIPLFVSDTVQFTVGALTPVSASLDATPLYVLEGTQVAVPINVNPGTHPAFDIEYSFVESGDATANNDYQSITGAQFVVEENDAVVDDGDLNYIEINAYNDSDVEPSESLTVSVTTPTDPPPGPFVRPLGWEVSSSPSTRSIVIVDDDSGRSLVDVSSPSLDEGGAGDAPSLTFVLTLDGPATGTESVDVTTVADSATEGTDYVGSTQTVTFALGATTAEFEVELTGDGLVEPDETLDITLSNEANLDISSAPTATGTILNDDTPLTVSINQAAGQTDPTGDLSLDFLVTFNRAVTLTAGDVTVDPGTTGASTTATITGGPTLYNVAVTGMTDPGTVSIAIAAGAVSDAFGNVNLAPVVTDDEITYEVDNVDPTVTVSQAAGQTDPTTVSPIRFTVQFSESVSGFDATDITVSSTAGAGVTASVVDVDADTYTVELVGMTQSGNVTITVDTGAAQDGAGNASAAPTVNDDSVDFVLDTTAPTVTIEQASGQADPTASSPIRFTAEFSEAVTGFTNTDVTLSAGATGATTVSVITVDADTATIEVTGMTAAGTLSVAVADNRFADLAGNPNTAASTSADNSVDYVLGVQIVVPANITVNNAPGFPSAVVTYPAPTTSGGVPPVSASCSPVSGSTFPLGVTTVNCSATDDDGGTAAGSFTVTVVDNVAPSISVSSPSVTSAVPTAVSYVVTASDNTGAAPSVSCSPLSGSVFPVGVTTVNCTATDGTGNQMSASGTVTVTAPAAPQLQNLPLPITVDNDAGQGGAIVTYPLPTATGGVPPIQVVCLPASGSFFPVGTTTVTCVATDSGQGEAFQGRRTEASSSATFTVTVNDIEGPVVVSFPPLAVNSGVPKAVTYGPTVSDNSGTPPTVVCDPPSGSVFPLGTTQVSCTVTDASGNSIVVTGSVTVALRDRLPVTGSTLTTWLIMLATLLLASGLLCHHLCRPLTAPAAASRAGRGRFVAR